MSHFHPTTCLLVAALTGCGHPTPPTTMPPLRIEVAQARLDSMANRMEFIGFLASNFEAIIQPRVNGYLLSQHYQDGLPVDRGQLLFTIDPVQITTNLRSAEAQLQSAEAQLVEARNNHQRAVPLARIEAISQTQLDQYTAQHAAAEAAVRSAGQALRSAQLDVDYTRLHAPIRGVIQHAKVHVGDYVGPGTSFNVLTSIANIDTLTVDLSLPMAQYLRFAGAEPSINDNEGLLSDIRLRLADGTHYPHPGSYAYTRRDVANNTGTLVLVVQFPNPQHRLKAGQFARVEANVGPTQARIMIPQQCVNQSQGVNSVWVIAADSTAHFRRVTPTDIHGSMWCIDAGLQPEEWVAVTGLQKLHNGEKIAPQKRQ